MNKGEKHNKTNTLLFIISVFNHSIDEFVRPLKIKEVFDSKTTGNIKILII